VDGPDGQVIHGPGAYDMKSGLVVIETAISMLHELGLPYRPLRVVVAADEEVGSPTATAVVTEAAQGVVAALGFESPHPDGALKVGRRGSTRIRISVTGREAHAALDPAKGASAIDELIDQLLRVRGIVDAVPGEVLCNVGTISGGGKTNVVPAAAAAEIGLRFVDGDTEGVVLDALSSLAPIRPGAEVDVAILSRRPAWAPPSGPDALLDLARAAAATVGQTVDGRPAAGAADTNTTGALGIPTLDGLGPRGAGAHARHEHVLVTSLPQRAALVTALLSAL
jgi:glutamate carboxypeptidase